MIIKVQQPLSGTDMSNLLIYDKSRQFDVFVPVESEAGQELVKMLGKAPKAYFVAWLDKKGVLQVGRQVKGQEW